MIRSDREMSRRLNNSKPQLIREKMEMAQNRLNAHLRDSETRGCAEIVLSRHDGSCEIIEISSRKVRLWTAKLANIIAREN